MKKAKIMLLSLALFAVLGAALAFKAKTGNRDWCYTTRELDPNIATTNFCPLFVPQAQTVGAIALYATSVYNTNLPVEDLDDCEDPEKIKVCDKQPTLVID